MHTHYSAVLSRRALPRPQTAGRTVSVLYEGGVAPHR